MAMTTDSIVQRLLAPLEALVGRLTHWQRHYHRLRRRPTVSEAIGILHRRWNVGFAESAESPVFIFSAGWRSGSTLLQRLAMSNHSVLVWGEPYPYCDYIRVLAGSLRAFTDATPPDQFFLSDTSGQLAVDLSQWTACLYPMPQHLYAAHRQFYKTLYGDPAHARGYRRWGLKEVVLTCEEAAYLRWLFPGAKFVFLHRNPYDAYRSYRTLGGWYFRWPDQPVFTAARFGRVWRELTGDFLKNASQVDGFIIRYEDIQVQSPVLSQLGLHLGVELRPELAHRKVTGRSESSLPRIPRLELRRLRHEVEPLATDLCYKP
jgi:hypothetical protein